MWSGFGEKVEGSGLFLCLERNCPKLPREHTHTHIEPYYRCRLLDPTFSRYLRWLDHE